MTQEEIVKAIRVCAEKLGRNPNRRELCTMTGISEKVFYTRMGSMRHALEIAGLEVIGPGFPQPESVLLLDWGKVARKLKKMPTAYEYEREGRFTIKPFHTRYGLWKRTAQAFRNLVEGQGAQEEWKEVLAMIRREPARKASAGPAVKISAKPARKTTVAPLSRRISKGALLCDRPVYGPPLAMAELAHAPVNEMGVVFLFGAMARRLGFVVHRLQSGFPDCIAMREMAPGQWQRVRIEFEFESRNFLKHRHRADRCDLIVCWRDNWKECPIEVVELGKEIAKIEK